MRSTLLTSLAVMLLAVSCKKGNDLPESIPNNKAMAWNKTYGGTDYEFANAIVQLQNGDYVVSGATRSSGGDIGGSRVGYDAWLAKMDNSGNKQWSVTYGGMTDDEYSTGLISTPDGGFMMIGYSFNNYKHYAWAIKADATGNQQWKKSLTTSTDAKPYNVLYADGGYVISGYTSSGTNRDGWLVKVDPSGNTVWSKTFGGAGEDHIASLVKTSGGFLLAGYSNSPDGDIPRNKGNYDGWVMKVDDGGNKVWSANYGGSNEDYFKSVVAAEDGGFMVAGYTKSTDGDITLNRGGYDLWMMKIDGNGTKQWMKTYGGANEEYITTIIKTNDGGYLTMGYTNSTTWDVTRTYNDFGGWLLKVDASGNKTSASTYGERFDDFPNTLINTQDGGYMVAGYCYVETRGYDAWLVKITSGL